MIEKHERDNAMLAHLTSFAGYFIPLGSVIIPLILWQSQKKDNYFINTHGKESVNFNLSFLIYNTILIILMAFLIFSGLISMAYQESEDLSHFAPEILLGSSVFIALFILGGVLFIVKIILIIIATTKAYEGEIYKYPLTINFVK